MSKSTNEPFSDHDEEQTRIVHKGRRIRIEMMRRRNSTPKKPNFLCDVTISRKAR